MKKTSIILFLSALFFICSCNKKETITYGNDIAFKHLFVNLIMTRDSIANYLLFQLGDTIDVTRDTVVFYPFEDEDYLYYKLNFSGNKLASFTSIIGEDLAYKFMKDAINNNGKLLYSDKYPPRIVFHDIVFNIYKVGNNNNIELFVVPNYEQEILDIINRYL